MELSSSLKFTFVANSIGTSVEYSLFNLAVSVDPPPVLGVFGA